MYTRRFRIKFNNDLREQTVENGHRTTRTVARRLVEQTVEVRFDEEAAARWMGERAAKSKGAKCKDGFATVVALDDMIVLEQKEVL